MLNACWDPACLPRAGRCASRSQPRHPPPLGRRRSGLPARQTGLLDANDGAGWELAAALLRPREIVTDDEGGVKFVNTGKAPRLTAAQALKHPFVRAAAGASARAAAAAAADEGSGSRGRAGSGSRGRSGSAERAASPAAAAAKPKAKSGGLAAMWGGLKNRLFDLEARVLKEATATEVQTTVVQQLQADVAAGRASEAALRREQAQLADMQRSLASSVKEMNSVYSSARGFLSGILGGGGSRGQRGAAAAAAPAEAPPAPAKRLPKWAAKEVPLEAVDAGAARQQAAAAAQRQGSGSRGGSRSSGSWQEDEDEYDEQAAVAAAEAAGAAAAAAAAGAARTAWSFGRSALSGLSAFAASLKEEAQRNAEQAAAEAARQKEAAAAYMQALQALTPALTPAARWEEVEGRVPEAPEFSLLSAVRREQVGWRAGAAGWEGGLVCVRMLGRRAATRAPCAAPMCRPAGVACLPAPTCTHLHPPACTHLHPPACTHLHPPACTHLPMRQLPDCLHPPAALPHRSSPPTSMRWPRRSARPRPRPRPPLT